MVSSTDQVAINKYYLISSHIPKFFPGIRRKLTSREKLHNLSLTYDFIIKLMGNYIPDDSSFGSFRSRFVLRDTLRSHPLTHLLAYSDTIRSNGHPVIDYERLGIMIPNPSLPQIYPYAQLLTRLPQIIMETDAKLRNDVFPRDMPAISIFGSASVGSKASEDIAKTCTKCGLSCVTGGDGRLRGNTMRQIPEFALEYGASFVGFITTEYFYNIQGAGRNLPPEKTYIKVVQTIIQRNELLWKCSKGALCLNGGLGTIKETLYYMMKNIQTDSPRPIAVYNKDAYWSALINSLNLLGLGDEYVEISTHDSLTTFVKSLTDFHSIQ